MSYGRHRASRAHKKVIYTGGNITLNVTAITALHASALDIVLQAQVGDDIEYGFSGILDGSSAADAAFDVYSIVSAARVNPWGAGLSASLASTKGVPHWYAQTTNAVIGGSIIKTLVSGDLSSGQLTVRPYFAKTSATTRTLSAGANQPLTVWAKNLGPAEPN